MKTSILFTTEVMAIQLTRESQKAVKEELSTAIETLNSRRNLDIQENISDFKTEKDYEFPETLLANIGAKLIAYGKDLCPDFEGIMQDYWLQSYMTNDFHGAHQHAGSIVSGAYYLEADNAADIVFYNPDNTASYRNVNKSHFNVTPQSGMLLLFPSWLYHSVNLSEESNGERLMMSFNIR